MSDTGLTPAEIMMQRHAASVVQDSSPETTEQQQLEQQKSENSVPIPESEITESVQNVELDNVETETSAISKPNISSLEEFPVLGGGNGTKSGSDSKSLWSNLASGKSSTTKASPVASLFGHKTEIFEMTKDQQQPNIRATLAKFLLKLRKDTNTSIESSTSGVSGTTTFIIKGRPEDIYRAHRDILRELSVKRTETFEVPASVRYHIIGSKGSKLKAIIEKSQTQIQVGKRPEDVRESLETTPASPVSGEVDSDLEEEETIEVTLQGDDEGIRIAKDEIMAIVTERARTTVMKVKTVQYKVFPFLSEIVQSLETSSDNAVKIKVPDYFDNTKSDFITLSGDRPAVLEVKAKLEKAVEELLLQFGEISKDVDATKQKFISIKDVFKATGVLTTLNSTTTSSSVYLFGPTSKLMSAIEYLDTQAKSIIVSSLDISRAHNKDISHAKALARFFVANGDIKRIEEENQVTILVPSLNQLYGHDVASVSIEITGSNNDQITNARKALIALVNQYPQARVAIVNDIDSFFFKTLANTIRTIKSECNVAIILPEDATVTSDIVLVALETTIAEDDFAPSNDEIASALKRANAHFDTVRERQQDFVTRVISNIPAAEHKFILGKNGKTLEAILGTGSGDFVSVNFGIPSGPLVGTDKDTTFDNNSIIVRGVKDEVNRVTKAIDQAIENGKNEEVAKSYTVEFQFPVEFIKRLIGKGGSNLTKYREQYDVKIDIDEDGKAVVKGIKIQADAARDAIIAYGKQLADIVVLRLSIPSEYHAMLIGSGGKLVKRLEDKYKVRINFFASNGKGNNGSSDIFTDRPKTKDEVVVVGPSKGATKSKEELMDLFAYEKDNNQTKTLVVPIKSLARIIGKGGELINEIKDNSNTRIDINQDEAGEGDDASVPIVITGTKAGISEASAKINDIVNEFNEEVIEELEIDPKFYKSLIGAGGATMREILAKAGIEEGNVNAGKCLQIPNSGSKNKTVVVQGNKKVVAKILKIVTGMVLELENQVTEFIEVPQTKFRSIIGPGGSTRMELEKEFSVQIFVPRSGSDKEKRVKISGASEKVQLAKAKIEEITKDKWTVSMDTPRSLFKLISDRGNLERKIRYELNVETDHGSGRLPSDLKTKVPAEAVPDVLITDETPVTSKWTVVEESLSVDDEATIPWRFIGDAENCEKAKKIVEDALNLVKGYDTIGFLWLSDKRGFRRVVGAGGSRASEVRAKSGCDLVVPKDAKPNDVIIVRGTKAGVEKAHKLILASF
ncbi:hypothetical protein NADFUDRAFT_83891 [Nadsonia fulvescens var. elongata DSM 6958]|uniref:K Homology domain-containing protein n=1 Tax=Nadsonia fulvescens var. elongata DSM 6958 TaxID=857566 RepID=A0A1E3PHS4_9ASCO|nr:hypothetical protein NADFUDRAFT_83891 [Nadsonia fulvescens var. elongata DSM 6958]